MSPVVSDSLHVAYVYIRCLYNARLAFFWKVTCRDAVNTICYIYCTDVCTFLNRSSSGVPSTTPFNVLDSFPMHSRSVVAYVSWQSAIVLSFDNQELFSRDEVTKHCSQHCFYARKCAKWTVVDNWTGKWLRTIYMLWKLGNDVMYQYYKYLYYSNVPHSSSINLYNVLHREHCVISRSVSLVISTSFCIRFNLNVQDFSILMIYLIWRGFV